MPEVHLTTQDTLTQTSWIKVDMWDETVYVEVFNRVGLDFLNSAAIALTPKQAWMIGEALMRAGREHA